jgi:hypothetical protein
VASRPPTDIITSQGEELGKVKNVDTGERWVGGGHEYASRAADQKFVEAPRTAEKDVLSPHPASDRFAAREVYLAHRIPHHLLGDHGRGTAIGLSPDAALGE